MLIRAKTKTLFQGKPLTELQQKNSDLNIKEIDEEKEETFRVRLFRKKK